MVPDGDAAVDGLRGLLGGLYADGIGARVGAVVAHRRGLAHLARRCSVSELSHVDETTGNVRMVDVGAKPPMRRRAVARGRVRMAAATAERLRTLPKGDALTVARIAGIQAAKRTSDLIPLCHPLPLTLVEVDLVVDAEGVVVEAAAETTAQTGVEMEALTAVGRRRPDRLRHGEGGRQGDVDRRDHPCLEDEGAHVTHRPPARPR